MSPQFKTCPELCRRIQNPKSLGGSAECAGAGGQGDSMKKTQVARGSRSGQVDPPLANKPIYGNQTLADGIDSKEQTLKSHGAEQRGTVRGNEARRRDFFAVQSQPSFCHGPYVSLPARDHDTLRTSRIELKLFRQRSGHHAKCSTRIHEQLNVFTAPRWTGETTFYMKQSHIKNLLENEFIVAQLTNKTTLYK